VWDTLRPDMEEVELPFQQVLSDPDRALAFAVFPLTGMISLVQRLLDGSMAEVGIIGREGFLGVSALHGVKTSPIEAMVQIAGHGGRMRLAAFSNHVDRSPAFRTALSRYAEASLIQTSQTVVCNARHTLQQRLGRWLLEARRCIQSDRLPLTHELLAIMLATSRPAVTTALAKFKKNGLISVGHRRVTIENVRAVEDVACECQQAVAREYERLLSPPAPPPLRIHVHHRRGHGDDTAADARPRQRREHR
jgi:CRP-like cAMP-binding protein